MRVLALAVLFAGTAQAQVPDDAPAPDARQELLDELRQGLPDTTAPLLRVLPYGVPETLRQRLDSLAAPLAAFALRRSGRCDDAVAMPMMPLDVPPASPRAFSDGPAPVPMPNWCDEPRDNVAAGGRPLRFTPDGPWEFAPFELRQPGARPEPRWETAPFELRDLLSPRDLDRFRNVLERFRSDSDLGPLRHQQLDGLPAPVAPPAGRR